MLGITSLKINMKHQAVVILVISVIVSVYISTRFRSGCGASGLVVKSASFDHQVADFIKFNGSRVAGVGRVETDCTRWC